MFGRMIRIAALAGAGAMAWRWWQNKQAEDRAYATGDSFPSKSDSYSSTNFNAPTGMKSSTGERVDQVPAQ